MDYHELKKHVGKKFTWQEIGQRYIFDRYGFLDKPYRGKIAFNGTYDYYPVSHYKNLRMVEEDGEE